MGLDEVLRSTFVALRNAPPTEEERYRLRAMLLIGAPFSSVLTEIAGGLTPVGKPPVVASARAAIQHLYQLAFMRSPSEEETQHWLNPLLTGSLSPTDFVVEIATSEEAKQVGGGGSYDLPVPDGVFVQLAYDAILHRGAGPEEIASWQAALAGHLTERKNFINSVVSASLSQALSRGTAAANDSVSSYILGRNKHVSSADWSSISSRLADEPTAAPAAPKGETFRFSRAAGSLAVSVICSLYRGGEYIKSYMENITSQSIFLTNCELIIIDANSPENEYDIIKPYLGKFTNIRYVRTDNKVSIYDAWNMAASMSAGDYLTNANLDDLRRFDSLERQAAVLDELAFIDVAYQDVFYSFDSTLSFDEVAAFDISSNVPVITPYNMLKFNSPHNAPMWRRGLHDEIGYFDSSYRSAGDYEFWLRCLKFGKLFYKLNDPHVVYFVNPRGLSTRPDTRGVEEAHRITLEYSRQLISPHLTSSVYDFVEELARRTDQDDRAEPDPRVTDWRYAEVQKCLRAWAARSRKTTGRDHSA